MIAAPWIRAVWTRLSWIPVGISMAAVLALTAAAFPAASCNTLTSREMRRLFGGITFCQCFQKFECIPHQQLCSGQGAESCLTQLQDEVTGLSPFACNFPHPLIQCLDDPGFQHICKKKYECHLRPGPECYRSTVVVEQEWAPTFCVNLPWFPPFWP